MDDLLIRGASLYDGSGADPTRADLAARGRRTLGRLAGTLITEFVHGASST